MHLANAVTDGHDDYADGSAFVHQLQTSRKTTRMKGNDSFHGLDCLSPRLMLSKLLRRRRKQRELAKVEDVKVETIKEELQGSKLEELDRDQSKHQIRCLPEESRSNKDLDSIGVAGQYGKDTCFNMAVGLGFLHLLSISKNELNKMVELRTQMELLFQNVKDESSQKKNSILTKPSETTNCIVDSENSVSYDRSVVLEAELKAEMELMQLHLNNDDEETSSEYQKQQSMEMTFGDASDHHQEESIVNVNFGGGVVDHAEEVSFAVCPMELERRLYGLLEIRQKERIHHLEAALESAKLKISEREKEIYRWKYAARYVSRRVPNSQSLSR
ncbi:protein POLAR LOCALIZATION DURING ASYMMETRIC DIVISION AND REDISTRIBUTION-like [Impatiens glandulifera]|uniref:protein POLAR LOCALIZATION DURING ASYMMETRIC DIVISION AND REDISTRIBUTION-like n=1 Tax=Impatiens glandulifera TaxID=253017 RepID=UPI001FB051C2|nr:protein POLAR LOCALIZATION DURING ASYMMETRIC DIVISION AND REDISTRIBUTION-like [Impatiens glandulifera]